MLAENGPSSAGPPVTSAALRASSSVSTLVIVRETFDRSKRALASLYSAAYTPAEASTSAIVERNSARAHSG